MTEKNDDYISNLSNLKFNITFYGLKTNHTIHSQDILASVSSDPYCLTVQINEPSRSSL